MVWMRRRSIHPCALVISSSNAPVASLFQLNVKLQASGLAQAGCKAGITLHFYMLLSPRSPTGGRQI